MRYYMCTINGKNQWTVIDIVDDNHINGEIGRYRQTLCTLRGYKAMGSLSQYEVDDAKLGNAIIMDKLP